ncbi:MAG TPA: hypothetical protein PKE06_21345 [Flavilitoribacter sp.]|nr:hypothetical protein [Lewinella sp.]MCB9280496.1 hypothetical protein [Lewinellaceae bacterium]HMQ63244.1 hypothetical protein [Flavilitoribacter sp.]HMQ90658.1 hypothetical protein [Flavilitoribacter sp.]
MKKNLTLESFDQPELVLDETRQNQVKGGFDVRKPRLNLESSPGSRITWDGIDIRRVRSINGLSHYFSIRGGNVTHDINP